MTGALMTALVLFAGGLFMSAFFSGTETGLYRVTRVRLVIGALGGDVIARGLLWLTNRPSMFVATTLVGNNLANYLVSLGVVIGASRLFPGGSQIAEMLAPLLLAPVVFVFGESMPKTVFYAAPNHMLKRCGLPILACTVLFLPVTSVLWIVSRILEAVVGQSPQRLRVGLARRELQQVFEEGREAGILNPAQQDLAQGLFALANQPVGQLVIPAAKMIVATTTMSKQEILRLARRHRHSLLPVEGVKGGRKVVGYFRVVDLYLKQDEQLPPPLPMTTLQADEPVLRVIAKLHESGQSLAHVVEPDGKSVGFVTLRQLSEAIFGGR
jgi:CBS domain containing-hemolysin-like protein